MRPVIDVARQTRPVELVEVTQRLTVHTAIFAAELGRCRHGLCSYKRRGL